MQLPCQDHLVDVLVDCELRTQHIRVRALCRAIAIDRLYYESSHYLELSFQIVPQRRQAIMYIWIVGFDIKRQRATTALRNHDRSATAAEDVVTGLSS